MKVVIIGGVAAGMSAASKIKRENPETEVVVYEAGAYLSYGACGLPYYVSGENQDSSKLIARTEAEFNKTGIKTFLRHEVLKVFPEKKQLFIKNKQTSDLLIENYDKLMIATGAKAVSPAIVGKDGSGVYQLKTMEDGLILRDQIKLEAYKNIVVVGGGYIGIEVAESLNAAGKIVTLIEFGQDILAPFDSEITEIAREHLVAKGVSLRLNEAVEEIYRSSTGEVTSVKTNRGVYQADLVVLATGIKPATSFLKDSGLLLAKNGAIIIDREMRTNLEDIYAAGDCATVYNFSKQENDYIPLGTTANKCGRIAGGNILGAHDKFVGALGSAAIKIGDYELGRTGLSEIEAKKQSYKYKTIFVKTQDHPVYYPNPTDIYIKLIYEKHTLKLLGAQAIGKKGVVLRIDMFAIGIHGQMTTKELGMVDLCYAPPFAGVWDAVHIASNIAK